MLNLLKELCDINAVTGFEEELALFIAEKIKDYCDKLYVSRAGNLIAFKKGKKKPSGNIMYCAHLDEVGMMIRHINDDGTLLFEQIGIMPEVLASKRVVIGKNKIPGVICSKPVHLTKNEKIKPDSDNMYIDIGTHKKEQSEALGVYADFAAFENHFTVFGNRMVCAKALDDRIGCAAMIKMICNDLEYDSYFAFTTGEEAGGIGVIEATREINPEISIILECTTASDLPSNTGCDKVCIPGQGAVVPFMDRGTLYSGTLYKKITELAKSEGIKIQTKSKVAGGTDAANIQKSVDGAKVCAVSLPCRYIHSSSCVASLSDVEEYMKLVTAIDKNMDKIIK